MAFYSYYTDDYSSADFYPTPYHDPDYSYMSSIPFQDSFPQYSSWDDEFDYPPAPNYSVFTEPESMSFYSPPMEMGYDYSSNGFLDCDSTNPYGGNYSVYHYTEPKLLQHDPTISEQVATEFPVSHSAEEFNAPEFKKYNPNPYSGGYDPITTYGRPLPPNEEICYPRSAPRSDVVALSDGLPHGSVASPHGHDNSSKKIPIESKETNKKTKDVLENGGKATGEALKPVPPPVPLPNVDSPGDDQKQQNGDYGHISGQQVVQISYGSGLEAVDLCDTIFGYWPCLAKLEKQQQQQLLRDKCRPICDQESGRGPWEIAADYLFGSPMVYSHENYHSQQRYQFWSFLE